MEATCQHWLAWVTLIMWAMLQTKVIATPLEKARRKGSPDAANVGGQSDAIVGGQLHEIAFGEQRPQVTVRGQSDTTSGRERPDETVESGRSDIEGVQPITAAQGRSEAVAAGGRRSDAAAREERGKLLGNPPPSIIEEMEKRLMAHLGIKNVPQVKKPPEVPPYMLKLYRKSVKNQRIFHKRRENKKVKEVGLGSSLYAYSPTFNSSIVRSFSNIENPGYDIQPDGKTRLYFDVKSIPKGEILRHARLRLAHTMHYHPVASALTMNETVLSELNWRSDDAPCKQKLSVYDILQKANTTSRRAQLLGSKIIDARKGGVKNFNVFPAIKRWISNPQANFGLLVEAIPYGKIPEPRRNSILQTEITPVQHATDLDASHISLLKPSDDDQWYKRQPLLIVYTEIKETNPRSEEIPSYIYEHPTNYCRRHPLYVDFLSVGWDDWIVAPAGYNANYCKGICSFPLPERDAPFYALAQTMLNHKFPERVPQTCCIPTELSAISFLYLAEEGFVLKNHEDMVVERCGCR